MTDVVIVGSGASGVNAAYPLVEAGYEVTLLDFGNQDSTYESLIPCRPFSEIRRFDDQQHRYFLGENFQGVPFAPIRNGAQLTPPRLYITRDAERLMPVDSHSFAATESLAVGGLASGWGAGVFPFADEELPGLPISRVDLDPHYEAVAERIGVAGDRDDLLPFFGNCSTMMPPPQIDSNAETILKRYARRRQYFNSRGLYLGRTRLAMCTESHRGRGPQQYHDMDFWADANRSVYRPRWTLEELARFPNFKHIRRRFVVSFADRAGDGVDVVARIEGSDGIETHRGRALVLAAGTLSTARIVLRSLRRFGTRVPLLCNSHTYAPVINFGMLGREPRDRRHSLAQLTAIYCPKHACRVTVQAQFFSYRSLLAFRLLKDLPLPLREGLRVSRLLMPLLGILVIQYEDHRTPAKHCALRQGAEGSMDRLEICYELSPDEAGVGKAHQQRILRFFRQLGCWPIKTVHPGYGSSIHYAGTFPMTTEERELSCNGDGLLAGTRSVYLVDGSIFPYLPAKGLTFTMMANANRVATRLARKLAC